MRRPHWILLAVVLLAGVLCLLPGFLRTRAHHYTPAESAALASLRQILAAETAVRSGERIDVDWDGRGEFGTLVEMTGRAGARTFADGTTRGAHISPPLLPPGFNPPEGRDLVVRSGYCFRVFLPAGAGTAATETDQGRSLSAPVATDLAEDHWCAYAWPEDFAKSGGKAFYIDEDGEVWLSGNSKSRYSGASASPAWDAALPAGAPRAWTTRRDTPGPGNDGEGWLSGE